MQAVTAGNLDGLVGLLAQDAVLRADGGGVVNAARNPIFGSDRIARFMLGIQEKQPADYRAEIGMVNGQAGVIMYAGDGLNGTVSFEVHHGLIQNICIQINPHKLPAGRP